MKERTKEFAKQLIRICRQLPGNREGRLIGNQLFRSGTSVGSNYRPSCRARTRADFVAKMGVVLEETDETLYWLELLLEVDVMEKKSLEPVIREANELVAIFVATLNKAKERK